MHPKWLAMNDHNPFNQARYAAESREEEDIMSGKFKTTGTWSPFTPPPVWSLNSVIDHPFMETIQRVAREREQQSTSTPNPPQVDQKTVEPMIMPVDREQTLARFHLGQEVHLLNEEGNDAGRPTTYIITSIHQSTIQPRPPVESSTFPASLENSLLNSQFIPEATPPQQASIPPNQPNNPPTTQSPQLIYVLSPSPCPLVHAGQKALLPVGFPLGADVKQENNFFSSVVTRRTVHLGKRYYDVKDEVGDIYRDVPEEDLTYYTPGLYDNLGRMFE